MIKFEKIKLLLQITKGVSSISLDTMIVVATIGDELCGAGYYCWKEASLFVGNVFGNKKISACMEL